MNCMKKCLMNIWGLVFVLGGAVIAALVAWFKGVSLILLGITIAFSAFTWKAVVVAALGVAVIGFLGLIANCYWKVCRRYR